MKTRLFIFIVMATMLTSIVFAQSATCDTETKKTEVIHDKCVKMPQSSTNDYYKCLQEYRTQQANAEKRCPRLVNISELEKRNDVYFKGNKPYSGKVNCSDCDNGYGGCGYSCKVNMKNGKLHGIYWSADEVVNIIGSFMDGKKYGEWKFIEEDSTTVIYYIDDKEQGEKKTYDKDGKLYGK